MLFQIVGNYHMGLISATNDFTQYLIIFAWIISLLVVICHLCVDISTLFFT